MAPPRLAGIRDHRAFRFTAECLRRLYRPARDALQSHSSSRIEHRVLVNTEAETASRTANHSQLTASSHRVHPSWTRCTWTIIMVGVVHSETSVPSPPYDCRLFTPCLRYTCIHTVNSISRRRSGEIPTLDDRPGGERQPAPLVPWNGTRGMGRTSARLLAWFLVRGSQNLCGRGARDVRTRKREIHEKTRRPMTSSSTIPTCENPEWPSRGIGPGSPWWEASRLSTQPPSPHRLKRAKCDLVLSIHVSELMQIQDCVTSHEVWRKLHMIYQSKGPARKANLLKKIILSKMKTGQNARTHVKYVLSSDLSRTYSATFSSTCAAIDLLRAQKAAAANTEPLHLTLCGERKKQGGETGRKREGIRAEQSVHLGAEVAGASSTLASHQGEPGSIPGRVTGFSQVGILPLVGGPSRGSPVSPAPSFRRCSILTSITLIGSLDLAVKSRLNLLTHSFKVFWPTSRGTVVYVRCRSGIREVPGSNPSQGPFQMHLEVFELVRCTERFVLVCLSDLADLHEAADFSGYAH
ncbi:hypothetical protein PR048_017698 [Dryococelus australis]|uniref:Uncharacterized protein n=1 Tax=Dryococelus australis TaxID=614101 RepID=A0ABQ9HAC4_9NEOP|nr:hypothetical protein PR048_017698 [Dryococelus australis]